jgi:hypothetical protein
VIPFKPDQISLIPLQIRANFNILCFYGSIARFDSSRIDFFDSAAKIKMEISDSIRLDSILHPEFAGKKAIQTLGSIFLAKFAENAVQ